MKIAVVANTDWYVFNFRFNLLRALKRAGHELVVCAPEGGYAQHFVGEQIAFRPLEIDGKGMHPLKEARSALHLARLFRRENVDLVLSFTPKGNIYSSFALLGTGARQIANVSGLGYAFIRDSVLTRFVRLLYRLALSRAAMVFFENEDDLQVFLSNRLVPRSRTGRLPGAGVDLSWFASVEQKGHSKDKPPQFLLVARMLWDKGVQEFVDAARLVRIQHPQATFSLLGFLNAANPSAIPKETIDAWVEEGIVGYLGQTDDIRPYVSQADCVVLPSYREGVPRSLLEAAAMARPVITTDAPGCRDVIDDGKTGLLCLPRSAQDLARCMLAFIEMTPEARAAMGQMGRAKMEREFDEQSVIDRYVAAIDPVMSEGTLGNKILHAQAVRCPDLNGAPE